MPSPMTCFRIGLIELDPLSRTLSRGEIQLRIEPKIFDVLWLMLHSPNQQVSREQLIEGIWQQRVVSDSVIHRVFSQLRKQFAVLDDSQDYIQTIAKVGYRLVVDVVHCPPAPDVTTLVQAPSPSTVVPSPTAAPASPHSTLDTAQDNPLRPRPWARLHGLVVRRSRTWQLVSGALLASVASYQLVSRTVDSPTTMQPPFVQQFPLTSHAGSETHVSSDKTGQVQLYLQHDQHNQAMLWRHHNGHYQPLLPHLTGLQFAMQSPDGTLAVLVQHSPSPQGQCTVWLASLNTSPIGLRSLWNCPTDSNFRMQWRADSRGFYFRQRVDKTKPYSTFYMDVSASQPQQISLPASHVTNGDIAVAPSSDHRQLVIAHYKTATQTELQFWTIPAYQRQTSHLIDLAVLQVLWQDQEHLLLVADKQVYRYHIPSRRYQAILAEKNYINSLAISDTRWFVGVSEQNSDILQARLPQSCDVNNRQAAFQSATAVVQSSRQDVLPRISPDGKSLAFLSDRQGEMALWLKSLTADTAYPESTETALPPFPAGQHFLRMQWSPDSQRLVYSQADALYLQTVGQPAAELVLSASAKAHSANWSDDGKRIIFGSSQSGDWQLWQYQLGSQQVQQLTTQGGYNGYVRGDQLFFSKFNQPGLYQKTLGLEDERLLVADFSVTNWLNWQLQGDAVYYFKAGTGVMRYQLSDGSIACVFPEVKGLIHQYSVQGSTLYFTHAQPVQGDIYWLTPPQ